MTYEDKPIAAIATPPGTGGVSIIRISGKGAIETADRIFQGKQPLTAAESHTIHYGFITGQNGEKLDEVLVSIMRAPRTYTGEDTAEINTHGGIVVTHAVLERIIDVGARQAEPGEFTKRAFLNGRIDLSRAEAVIDLINAKSTAAQKNALSQMEGTLSEEINEIRRELVSLAAHMQVSIDYPDEDLEELTISDILNVLQKCGERVGGLLKTADNGRILREGVATAIVGKPNVGKSSLLNRLCGQNRAIVTDIAGTTRDVIEEYVTLNGVLLRLIDTAGIRETEDTVEKIGVERSLALIQKAELILAVIDGAQPFTEEDAQILERTKDSRRIILINKMDETDEEKDAAIRERISEKDECILTVSAKTGEGIDRLGEKIQELFHLGNLNLGGAVVTNLRHKQALREAGEAIGRAVSALKTMLPQDLAALDINEAIEDLGRITGASVSEDIVSEIFHSFCVGK